MARADFPINPASEYSDTPESLDHVEFTVPGKQRQACHPPNHRSNRENLVRQSRQGQDDVGDCLVRIIVSLAGVFQLVDK